MTPILIGTAASLLLNLTVLIIAARRTRDNRSLRLQIRELDRHARAMELRCESLTVERDRAYDTIVSYSAQLDALETKLAAAARPITLECGLPLNRVVVDDRILVSYGRN